MVRRKSATFLVVVGLIGFVGAIILIASARAKVRSLQRHHEQTERVAIETAAALEAKSKLLSPTGEKTYAGADLPCPSLPTDFDRRVLAISGVPSISFDGPRWSDRRQLLAALRPFHRRWWRLDRLTELAFTRQWHYLELVDVYQWVEASYGVRAKGTPPVVGIHAPVGLRAVASLVRVQTGAVRCRGSFEMRWAKPGLPAQLAQRLPEAARAAYQKPGQTLTIP